MNNTTSRLVVFSLVTAFLTAGCGGSDELPAPVPAPAPATPTALPFKVMPARASLAEGAEGSLSVFGAGAMVTWTSSDPAVVQVDTAGAVRALARGSATITATDGAKTSSATVKVWRTEGANADPSTESLIAAAMAAGRLSAEEALIYRVYALFGDERLPVDYDGAPDARAAVSMRQVSGQLPALSPATQEILRPFLIPPIYADSWFGRQMGLADTLSAQSGRARAMQAGTPSICSQEIVNAFLQAGLLVRRTTAHYNLYAFVTRGGNETALLDAAVLDIETIDGALQGLLRRHALSDAAEPCNGGDGAVDVYLAPLMFSSGNDWGQTTPYAGRCENTPAFVLIDHFKLGRIMTVDPARGRRYLRTVLAHELTHTIQFGMDRKAACDDYDWIDEATAQWAPDYVFPGDNEEDGFEKLGLNNAVRTGVYYVNYLQGGHRESIDKATGYTTYIYFQFMARKYGAASIKALFDAWSGHGSVDSLDVALKAVGSSLPDAWSEFGKALWNDVREGVLTDLRGWDDYDYGMADVVSKDPLALESGRITLDLLRANGGRIAPRSLAYERLVFTDEVSPVMLTNPLGTLPHAQHLKLTAVRKVGGQWREPEDWTGYQTKYFCRDKVSERVEELLLIVSNGDPDPNAAPVVLPSDNPFALSASNVGCWKWTGQAVLQIISEEDGSRSVESGRAVELVLESVSGYAGFGPMLLLATGGSASGLGTFQSASCNGTFTGPTKAVTGVDTSIAFAFNLDLKGPEEPVPDRKVLTLTGITFIDSTESVTCNGNTLVTPQPAYGWLWLGFPVDTNPLDVSADGKSIEANVTINVADGRVVHNFKFTAMRE